MTGTLLLAIGVCGIILYGWLLFFYNATLTLQITAFGGVAIILGIIGWIGYTMATTPPPEPLEVSDLPETSSAPEPKITTSKTEKKEEAPEPKITTSKTEKKEEAPEPKEEKSK